MKRLLTICILGAATVLAAVSTLAESSSKNDNAATMYARRAHGGDVSPLYDLLDRVLMVQEKASGPPSSHFVLKLCDEKDNDERHKEVFSNGGCTCNCQDRQSSLADSDDGKAWFCMEQERSSSATVEQQQLFNQTAASNSNDDDSSRFVIMGTSVSELSYGIGYYLRYYCNFTLGWERIGGSVRNLAMSSSSWPTVPNPVWKRRRVPYSYLMNVCTHSYSLVWHDWKSPHHGWEAFIDWASLMGINNLLALTGQEEIQYKVYRKLGLQDQDVRSWFNGPAFLTWSRGQNEYGSGIAGPLPRSWMQQQWKMQKDYILPRLKELNIIGQLPGFQGNVPIQLADLYPNSKMTKTGDTGWLDSTDPLFAKIADLWMSTLMQDFGRDNISHWYQLDGYFNGGVPPWLSRDQQTSILSTNSQETNPYSSRTSLGRRELEQNSAKQDTTKSVNLSNTISHDDMWYQRGVAAYTGLNRTDPDAIWSFQGFSFIGWNDSDITASWLKGFVDSAPPGKFVVIDMAYTGLGEWTKWNNASYFGANFIWSALHNFGDTNGLKGDMNRVASIIPNIQGASSPLVGIGATPEGIDQNPVYYEFLFDQAFQRAGDPPVPDVKSYCVERSHRRYACAFAECDYVTKAWHMLALSSYATDQSVQDTTGVAHRSPRVGTSQFESDRFTPKPIMCSIFGAWMYLYRAAVQNDSTGGFRQAPFAYDLINLGREVLAQLSVPMGLNFSDALAETPLSATRILETGNEYIQLLENLDRLVGSHSAFLVGPWIESARAWGTDGGNDCNETAVKAVQACSDFYEWNARVQITTWNPTMANDSRIPGGPIDYAAKHWSGLIKDYYAARASKVLDTALANAGESGTLNQTEIALREAQHAFRWSTSRNKYETQAKGDPLQLTLAMLKIYASWFGSCHVDSDGSD